MFPPFGGLYGGERLERTFSDRQVGLKILHTANAGSRFSFSSDFSAKFNLPPEVGSGDVQRTIASYKEKFPFHILCLFFLFSFFF